MAKKEKEDTALVVKQEDALAKIDELIDPSVIAEYEEMYSLPRTSFLNLWQYNKTVTNEDGEEVKKKVFISTMSMPNSENKHTAKDLTIIPLLYNIKARERWEENNKSFTLVCGTEDQLINSKGTTCTNCPDKDKRNKDNRKVCGHIVKMVVIDSVTNTPHVIKAKGASYMALSDFVRHLADEYMKKRVLPYQYAYKLGLKVEQKGTNKYYVLDFEKNEDGGYKKSVVPKDMLLEINEQILTLNEIFRRKFVQAPKKVEATVVNEDIKESIELEGDDDF